MENKQFNPGISKHVEEQMYDDIKKDYLTGSSIYQIRRALRLVDEAKGVIESILKYELKRESL